MDDDEADEETLRIVKRKLIDNLNDERERRGMCHLNWELMSH